MKDIDRNINSILYSKINLLESSVFNIDFSKYVQVYSKRVDINIDNDSENTENPILKISYPAQPTLDAGEYYYLHVVEAVPSDNTQCLFSLAIKNNLARPFYSYYVQSPISDSNNELYIGHSFTLTEKQTVYITRNDPVPASFKLKSIIRIYRKVE